MINRSCAGDTSQSIKINAVTGAILKNHPKSWFERFHLKSERAKELLKAGQIIVVLQITICGDMEVIAELVYRKDYESVAKNQEGQYESNS